MTDAIEREVVPVGAVPGDDIVQSIGAYEAVMLRKIAHIGLPGTDVVVSLQQRGLVLQNVEAAIAGLDAPRRSQAPYISKFIMAVGAGLFDAALNYLWDETINELRARVVNYDLSYFYDLAVTSPERRSKLQGPDDLVQVTDYELVAAANSMGLVSDLGRQQLDLVRYMRNFASAAHPNQNEITGLQLLSFLETCILQVIALPESTVVAEVGRLMRNLKVNVLVQQDAVTIATFFADLPSTQADNLARGFFGLYSDLNSSATTRDNIRLLVPYLWPLVADDVKQDFGRKYARFLANNDSEQAGLARELLDAVGATSYLPEAVRIAEIDEVLDSLALAHGAMNNFYNEPPLARSLRKILGDQDIPAPVLPKLVSVLVRVFLGRPSGLAVNADPIYEAILTGLNPTGARLVLLSILDVGLSTKLGYSTPQAQFRRLMTIVSTKLPDLPSQDLYAAITSFSGGQEKLGMDTNVQRLAKLVPRA